MAFEGLSEKLNAAFKRLRGKGRLTENDVREAMREVRLALLEGDVILAANGVDTPTLYALTRVRNDTGVGIQVELSVLRDGGVLSISITLYDRLT